MRTAPPSADTEELDGSERDTALAILRDIAPYRRLMLAGMLADLTHEHFNIVKATDCSDPDPTAVNPVLRTFQDRVRVLFLEGHIMAPALTDSFTGQIREFLRGAPILYAKNLVFLFALPADTRAEHEPLERMRAISKNVLACLEAALPPTAWQRCFSSFALPWPTSTPEQAEHKALIFRILKAAGHERPEDTYTQLTALLPAVEAQVRSGCKVHSHSSMGLWLPLWKRFWMLSQTPLLPLGAAGLE